jgi:hypothetical protein
MVPISEEVSRLTSVAKKLNEATESHNKLIEKLEADLQKSGVGVACWAECVLVEGPVTTFQDENEMGPVLGHQESWDLGYQKLGDTWRIVTKKVICTWPIGDTEKKEWSDGDDAPIPLLKAPRAVRVEAAPFLEQLVRKLREKAELYIKAIDTAAAAFEK